MKKKISEIDLKEYNTLFSVEFSVMVGSAYLLLRFFEICGIIIWIIISFLTLYTGLKIEKIYKRNDCRTYKEIVEFRKDRLCRQRNR